MIWLELAVLGVMWIASLFGFCDAVRPLHEAERISALPSPHYLENPPVYVAPSPAVPGARESLSLVRASTGASVQPCAHNVATKAPVQQAVPEPMPISPVVRAAQPTPLQPPAPVPPMAMMPPLPPPMFYPPAMPGPVPPPIYYPVSVPPMPSAGPMPMRAQMVPTTEVASRICLVKEEEKVYLKISKGRETSKVVRSSLEIAQVGNIQLAAGKTTIHLTGDDWKATAEQVEIHPNGLITLVGKVKLSSSGKNEVKIQGERLEFILNQGKFTSSCLVK